MEPYIKAILFDFDGVLARTIEHHFNAWKRAMEHYGISIKEEDYYPLEGMKLSNVAKTIFTKCGKSLEFYNSVVDLKIKYYLESPRCEIYPGVLETLDLLERKKIKKAVVSASVREQLEKNVGKAFLDRFDCVICGDSTKLGKPSPDPYLAACARLNVSPANCMVVENAPLGVQSSKAAGIYCIAICSTNTKENLKEADLVLTSIKDLFVFLKDTL